MESPVNGEGGSFVDAWWVERLLPEADVDVTDKLWWLCFFFLSSRLYVLQGGLAQQEWRVPELLHRLLQYLEPKLTQVYKNVRERIGRWGPFYTPSERECTICHYIFFSPKILVLFLCLILFSLNWYPSSVLTYIFMIDVNLPYTQPTTSPRISDFTERILLQLKPLTEGDEEIQNHVVEENEVGEQDERTQAIKLLKTGWSRICHYYSELSCHIEYWLW